MKYDYVIECLKYEIENCAYKRDYPSMTAIAMGESLDNKIKKL